MLRRGKFSKPLFSPVEVLPWELVSTFRRRPLNSAHCSEHVAVQMGHTQPTGKQSWGARLLCCGLGHPGFVIERPGIPVLGN